MRIFSLIIISLVSTGALASRLPVYCEGPLKKDRSKELYLYPAGPSLHNHSKLFYEIKIYPFLKEPGASATYALATVKDRAQVLGYEDLAGPLMEPVLGGYRGVGH